MLVTVTPKENFIDCFSVKRNVNALRYVSKRRDINLDVWRSSAMFLVYIFHCFFYARYTLSSVEFEAFYNATPLFLKWVWAGDRGVDIFFVISGYLIGCLLFNELNKSGKINIRYFYYRRSIRIIPVYSLAIVFYFLVGASYKEELWANIIFVNNMLPAEQSAMAWCWSLAVEEQFYFLLPIIFIASYRFNVDIFKLLLGALVLSLIVRCYMLFSAPVLIEASTRSIMFDGLIFNDFFNVMYNNLTTRFGELSVGVISAYVYTYKKLEMEVYFKSTWGAVSQFLCCVVIFFMFFYGGFQFDKEK